MNLAKKKKLQKKNRDNRETSPTRITQSYALEYTKARSRITFEIRVHLFFIVDFLDFSLEESSKVEIREILELFLSFVLYK